MIALILISRLILGGASSDARAPGSDGNPYLAQARVLFQGLEYEKALARLAKAERWEGTSVSEHAEILIYRGLCRFYLGEETGARAAFREAAHLDPHISLPPFSSPRVRNAFAEEAAKVRASTSAASTPEAPPPVKASPSAPVPPAPAIASPAPTLSLPPPKVEGIVQSVLPGPPPETPAVSVRWPSIVAGAAAVILTATAIGFGLSARSAQADAQRAEFGSDKARISATAQSRARAANALYGAGAGAGVVGAALFFVF